MAKIKFLVLIAAMIVSGVSGQDRKGGYSIVGVIHGFSNGTKLYLSDLTDGSYNHQIDSAIIKDNGFGILVSLILDTPARLIFVGSVVSILRESTFRPF